ncbi:hypothetical protein EVAR_43346_1 [Eumeta japonica]|uniref:Uncharacterized protein n=1 Tax=Eumeta variegata TaxID=151549 RepID=A0A4C1WQC4_EUMVA|nr:hypothetical protein EVAR_43346_1 [Eumeta japonica]
MGRCGGGTDCGSSRPQAGKRVSRAARCAHSGAAAGSTDGIDPTQNWSAFTHYSFNKTTMGRRRGTLSAACLSCLSGIEMPGAVHGPRCSGACALKPTWDSALWRSPPVAVARPHRAGGVRFRCGDASFDVPTTTYSSAFF